MYAELPEQIKRVVREYLLVNDFKTAKEIHDNWFAEQITSGHSLNWQLCSNSAALKSA
jgi:hypothetical protein